MSWTCHGLSVSILALLRGCAIDHCLPLGKNPSLHPVSSLSLLTGWELRVLTRKTPRFLLGCWAAGKYSALPCVDLPPQMKGIVYHQCMSNLHRVACFFPWEVTKTMRLQQ